ncbi:DUF433 domain-containing protein [Sphaerospermopsis torques-reginae]|jgi:uncharacterized protein (DUF433 family)|nr:DUF433 domain-containing protein [Sphaerospermopsis torques-reginae]
MIIFLLLIMVLAIVTEPAPLETTKDGVVVIRNSRVTLDTIVAVFNQGVTAEEIAYRYPSLMLADVYAAIAFYLHHQEEVDSYLQQRQQQKQEVRQINEARFNAQDLRNRLISRQANQKVC